MLEMGTSGLMSGEGKQPSANRLRSRALPRLYQISHPTSWLAISPNSETLSAHQAKAYYELTENEQGDYDDKETYEIDCGSRKLGSG